MRDMLRYHDKINEIQQAIHYVNEDVETLLLQDSPDNVDKSSDNDDVLECVPIVVEEAVKDFQDGVNMVNVESVSQMVEQLNSDQKLIFDQVTNAASSNNEILRLFVSEESGTGKSFLIKTIRA